MTLGVNKENKYRENSDFKNHKIMFWSTLCQKHLVQNGQFPVKCILAKLSQEELETLKTPIIIKKLEH